MNDTMHADPHVEYLQELTKKQGSEIGLLTTRAIAGEVRTARTEKAYRDAQEALKAETERISTLQTQAEQHEEAITTVTAERDAWAAAWVTVFPHLDATRTNHNAKDWCWCKSPGAGGKHEDACYELRAAVHKAKQLLEQHRSNHDEAPSEGEPEVVRTDVESA